MADPSDLTVEESSGVLRALVSGPGRVRVLLGMAVAAGGLTLVTWVARALGETPGGIRPAYVVVAVAAAAVGGLWVGLSTAVAGIAIHLLGFEQINGASLTGERLLILGYQLLLPALVAWEEAARSVMKASRRRLAFLARAAELLASSHDVGESLGEVGILAVPEIADWCAIQVDHSDGPGVYFAHRDPAKVEEIAGMFERFPPRSIPSISTVIETGRPLLLDSISDERLRELAVSGEHLEMLGSIGMRSAIVAPLSAGREIKGIIVLAYATSPRRYRREDLGTALDLARVAAITLENARRREESAQAARMLQNSLLPPSLPPIPGVQIEGRYLAAGEGTMVGGDFYDAFEVSEGDWVLAIGDVCGKGPEAAALTGLVRHTIRAASIAEGDPAAVLKTVNREILRDGSERFCTVTCARLHRNRAGLHLTVSSAGHPPPVVLRNGRNMEATGSLGTLLGVMREPRLATVRARLEPGDLIILYTDGVTDPFERKGLRGDTHVAAVAAEGQADPARVADHIVRTVVEARVGPPRDDLALLILGVAY